MSLPFFCESKSEGNTSTNPLKESFGNRYNLKFVLLALFELLWVKGCMVYWTILRHEFYENCNVIDSSQVDTLLGIALILELHFYCLWLVK
jgi:hypothetical protein